MTADPEFASPAEAVEAVCGGLGYLAALDPTQLPVCEQARLLQVLELAHALETAARTSVLDGFTAAQGYHEDGDYSPRSWLINRTGVTKGAATAHTEWVKRAHAHPRVIAALAARDMSESFGRKICDWTGQLPEDCQDSADAILVAAAVSGRQPGGPGPAGRGDLRPVPAAGPRRPGRRVRGPVGPAGDHVRGRRGARRGLDAGMRRGGHGGAGRAVGSRRGRGPADPRAAVPRRAAGRDAAPPGAGLLPGRAGQPVRAWAHMSLAELLALDGNGALLGQWVTTVRARWAGHRAAASVGRQRRRRLAGRRAAAAVACDALITPVVTGEVDPGALDGLVRLCVELARLGPGPSPDAAAAADRGPAAPAAGPSSPAREALERAIIGQAVALLSGPGGLASFLRREQLGAPLAGPSLPLDIGYSDTVPAAIRHAVTLRDQHCRWAGGCSQPAAACQVHHVRHKANGGPTSVKDCILLCFFHHQVVIHRWGWTLVLNADGTTTAWNPDRTKVLHSHSPPARAG